MNDPVFITALIGMIGGLALACGAYITRRAYGLWAVVLGWLAFFLVVLGFMDAVEFLATAISVAAK